MRICQVHVEYQQAGGEDESVRNEAAALRLGGHDVAQFVASNSAIGNIPNGSIEIARSWATSSSLMRRLDALSPDIVHFNNTHFAIGPAAIRRVSQAFPTVVTLRNYRLECAAATFWRDQKICTDCTSPGSPWAGVRHRCFRDSALATALVSLESRMLRAALADVSVVIVASEYVRTILTPYVTAVSDAPIRVKPNCLTTDRSAGAGGSSILYVGRMATGKGLAELLRIWSEEPTLPELVLCGTGPLEANLRANFGALPNVRFMGMMPFDAVLDHMSKALALIVPSEWPEPFGRVVIESMAMGTPVLASKAGGLAELGKLAGVMSLARLDARAVALGLLAIREGGASLRRAARVSFEQEFSTSADCRHLESIYSEALSRAVQ